MRSEPTTDHEPSRAATWWVAFALTTPLQIAIILTANYAFLNYLVLFLGVLLLAERDRQECLSYTKSCLSRCS